MGQTLRRDAGVRGRGRRASQGCLKAALVAATLGVSVARPAAAQPAVSARRVVVGLDSGFGTDSRDRFVIRRVATDARLAQSLLDAAMLGDTFPGLPRPRAGVTILIAPDIPTLRGWTQGSAAEWASGLAYPESHIVIILGREGTSSAGDQGLVIRHELAHVALHDYLGFSPPRWFDEGYASFATGAERRGDLLTGHLALLLSGVPRLATLDTDLVASGDQAEFGYAMARRAVADLSALDPEHGLSLLLTYLRAEGSMDVAVRRAYGESLDDFERHWQRSTRRRYGLLAAVSDVGFIGIVSLVILMPLAVARRRRKRARLEEMRQAEAAAELAAEREDAPEPGD